MAVLTRAKKARIDGESWQMVRINPSQEEILQKLELIPRPEEPPKKKCGRPAGSKNKKIQTPDAELAKEPEKRRRGRPPGSKNKPKASTSTIQT